MLGWLAALSKNGAGGSDRLTGYELGDLLTARLSGGQLPLIGREAEHAALAAAFRSARSSAAAALVIGEAGLGKSRLAQEFILWAEAHGADVLRGRGFEVGGRLPYQPIVEALRQRLSEEAESDRLLPDEPWRGHLARLLPELGQAAQGDGPQDRLHLFKTVSRLVGGLAASGPVVLAIDDLHWSDEGSLDMLRYTARRMSAASRPFLLLGCVRSEELAMQQGLGSWAAELRAHTRHPAERYRRPGSRRPLRRGAGPSRWRRRTWRTVEFETRYPSLSSSP